MVAAVPERCSVPFHTLRMLVVVARAKLSDNGRTACEVVLRTRS